MPSAQDLCEYYVDSRVERVSGNEKTVKTPRIYFERNLEKPDLPYRLFAVVEEWLPGASGDAPYDTVKIYYESGVIDCAAVYAAKKNVRTYKQIAPDIVNGEYSVVKDGNILLIKEALLLNPSGAGCIEMLSKGESVAKFYFGVNCAFRKKIFYEIRQEGRNAHVRFECKSEIAGKVRVHVLGHPERLPCLVSDLDDNRLETLDLEFKRGACQRIVRLSERLANAKGRKLFVVLDEEFNDMFVLESAHNATIEEFSETKPLRPSYNCPFCHGPIGVTALEKSKTYKSGGTTCDAESGAERALNISDENGSLLKNCLMCKKEFREDGTTLVQDATHKLLPEKFLSHRNFKIAFQGAPRAGKTTYISRFFGLKSILKATGKDEADLKARDYEFNMAMSEIRNTMKRFNVVVDPVQLPSISAKKDGSLHTEGIWYGKEMQYINRGMEIGRKLPPTDAGDYTGYPFIVEVNGVSYVSFYDIAGEDSRQSNQYVKKIAEHDENTIGIFFLITDSKEHDLNRQVAEQLLAAGEYLDPSCPVAVILTKMDAIGGKFDSSCACRRFDYYPPKQGTFVYDGSYVEKFINESSDEIKSFIEEKGGVDIEMAKGSGKDVRRFTNVKYFGISSFGFPESLYHINKKDDGTISQTIDDESYIRFATNARRMELPFLWMLRQFDLIR